MNIKLKHILLTLFSLFVSNSLFAEFSFQRYDIPGTVSDVYQIDSDVFAFVYESTGYVSLKNSELVEVDNIDFNVQINNYAISPLKNKMAVVTPNTGEIIEIDFFTKEQRSWLIEFNGFLVPLLDLVYISDQNIWASENNGLRRNFILDTSVSQTSIINSSGPPLRVGTLAVDRANSFLYVEFNSQSFIKVDMADSEFFVTDEGSGFTAFSSFELSPDKSKIVTSRSEIIRTSSLQLDRELSSQASRSRFSSNGVEIWVLEFSTDRLLKYFNSEDYVQIGQFENPGTDCGGVVTNLFRFRNHRSWLLTGENFVCVLSDEDIFANGFEVSP